MLVERHGDMVAREEVRQRLWAENTFVEFDNSLGVAIRKVRDALNDDAEAPRYIETVPRKGYRFLAPVTIVGAEPVAGLPESALEPSDRTRVPQDSSNDQPANTYGRLRYFLGAAFLLLVVGGAVYVVRSLRRAPATTQELTSSLPTHIRRSVAVIGFRNIPGHPEDNWLSPAFAEMLNTELAADGTLRMVSGEDVARAKRELPLSDEDSLAKGTLQRLRTDPGADVVVLGSYTPLPGKAEKRIRLDIRLQDTARGETIAETAFVGSEDDLFELAGQAGASLRQSLGAAPASTEAYAQARAALPKSPIAVRFYTEGQARLWAFEYMRARDLFIQAIAAEPDFPLSHAALSETWNHLGFIQKSRDEIERARSLSDHLTAEERLLIDGEYYTSWQQRNQAIEAYKKLFTQFPDNLDYGLRLGDQQRWDNPNDAVQTLASLRRLPAPEGADPRIDILESRVWINRDLGKAQSAARRAVEKGTASGSSLLVARANGILCQMIDDGASVAQAVQVCERAREGYATAGDRDNEARVANDFAGLYYQQGDLKRSEAMFREAIKVFREVGDVEGITSASSNLGEIFMARGNLVDAGRALSDALPGSRDLGDKDGVALTLNDLGEVARLGGDLGTALSTYGQAKTTAQEIDDKRALAYIQNGIGEVLLDRGDLEGARAAHQESLSLRKQIGEKQAVAESELALAQLSIEDHHAADAETVIRKCKEQFQQNQQADDELSARVALINAFLAERKNSEAAKEAADAGELARKSLNELIRLQFDLASARVELASGHLEASRTQLQKILQRARVHHLLESEFETRLTIAGLKRTSGKEASARADLLTLEHATRAKGFVLLANKALAMRTAGEKTVSAN